MNLWIFANNHPVIVIIIGLLSVAGLWETLVAIFGIGTDDHTLDS
jgi:hypothetical protein